MCFQTCCERCCSVKMQCCRSLLQVAPRRALAALQPASTATLESMMQTACLRLACSPAAEAVQVRMLGGCVLTLHIKLRPAVDWLQACACLLMMKLCHLPLQQQGTAAVTLHRALPLAQDQGLGALRLMILGQPHLLQ